MTLTIDPTMYRNLTDDQKAQLDRWLIRHGFVKEITASVEWDPASGLAKVTTYMLTEDGRRFICREHGQNGCRSESLAPHAAIDTRVVLTANDPPIGH